MCDRYWPSCRVAAQSRKRSLELSCEEPLAAPACTHACTKPRAHNMSQAATRQALPEALNGVHVAATALRSPPKDLSWFRQLYRTQGGARSWRARGRCWQRSAARRWATCCPMCCATAASATTAWPSTSPWNATLGNATDAASPDSQKLSGTCLPRESNVALTRRDVSDMQRIQLPCRCRIRLRLLLAGSSTKMTR